mgnify:CR=1 FL=1
MRILKRKKGKQEYFYLQHFYRDNGKLITKEKYLGKAIPKNIEEIKKQFRIVCQQDLYKRLESIKRRFQEEWKKTPKTSQEKEKEEIAIAFTYNTNAIEGSTITLEETREIIHEKMAPNKQLGDIKETEAHGNVFLQMLRKKEDLTKELL